MKRDRIILCADREPLHSMGAVRRSTHRMVVWHPPTRPMTSRLQLRYKQQCAAGTRGRHSQGNTPQRGRCRRCIEGCERVANLLSQQRDQQPNPRGSRARHHRGANRSAKSTESRRRASLARAALRWLEAESDKCNEAEYTHVWEAPEIQSWWKEAGEEEDAMQITRTTKSSTSRKSRSSSRMLGGFVSARSPRKSKS